jgi:polyphosphate kinase 2 (PPK2 family)
MIVLKFFLNVSRKEQKKRFLARIDDPGKNWKFSASDIRERKYWDDYLVLLCYVFANGFPLADNRRHAVECQAMATKHPTL